MIMILLVTAYNGMWSRGDGERDIQSYTQSYSKYHRRPRVRTASGGVPAVPSRLDQLMDAASGSSSQHTPQEVEGDRLRNNRIV